MRALVALWTIIIVGLSVSTAHAEVDAAHWPYGIAERPLSLAQGMIEIRGDTLLINMSKNSFGEPVSAAPDIWYGINNSLTVGITHQTGICFNNGCGYNDFGIEAIYGLASLGRLALAAQGGLIFPGTDPFGMGIRAGLVARLAAGALSVVAEPSVYLGISGRDSVQKDVIEFPLQIQYQLDHQANIHLSTGLTNGRLDGFGDEARVPIGLGVTYVLTHRIDVGAEFTFTNLLGPESGKTDGRHLALRAALRI